MDLTRLVDESSVAGAVLAGPRPSGVAMLAGQPSSAVDIRSITYDSRRVGDNTLFVCVAGLVVDGHDFAEAAVAAGAVALVVERVLPIDVPQLLVADARVAMASLAATLYGSPSQGLTVIGVTGTNGKTTTVHLLDSVLREHGWATGVIGTLTGVRTTPEAPELQAQLAAWRDDGREAVTMEVSSHALALHRVDAMRFAVAVFTNLSRDHLDFHGTMERYFDAKARLFSPVLTEQAVVNADDPHGRLLLDAAQVPTTPYSFSEVDGLELTAASSSFSWRGHRIVVPIGGRHNVSNALAAATAAGAMGIAIPTIAAGIGNAGPVPGRFEPIEEGQRFSVVVDYAHTPDGLQRVLAAAREVAPDNRVIVVFGCGGDRDRTKRPAMGIAAVEGADLAVVTSDNPRSEDPEAIIDEIVAGVSRSSALTVEPDRRRAIGIAFEAAGDGDVVVIAGKGHESTQTIGESVVPFDDRVVAREELARLPGGGRT
jgi:UDP-N-acetylmuramoyl-L-alanyl-D-glutamate--2,6-diaminopimelate ligase